MTTTATKLSRAQACAEIAKRLGFACVWDKTVTRCWLNAPRGFADIERSWTSESLAWSQDAPDFFTDPAASRTLVEWISTQSTTLRFHFAQAVERLVWDSYAHDLDATIRLLLATPEQISLAACRAMGIDTENEQVGYWKGRAIDQLQADGALEALHEVRAMLQSRLCGEPAVRDPLLQAQRALRERLLEMGIEIE